MPPNESDKLPHILISERAKPELYTSPASGGKEFNAPVRDRQAHGQKLLGQFDRLRDEAKNIVAEQKAFGIDAGNGIYLQFESEPDFELKFESLETIRSGIELLAVQKIENKTYATVFVPEGKLDILIKKVADYLEKETPKGKYRNKDLVESISEIKRATLEALWTDEKDLLPADEQKEIWWEAWLRTGENPEAIVDFFKSHSEHLGLITDPEIIHFPDRTVIAVCGTKAQMVRSLTLLNNIAELRKAKETAEFFTTMSALDQRTWIEDFQSRIVSPTTDCPMICILDTGINNDHPLLRSHLDSANMDAYDPNWGVYDWQGHGTEMAGLSLYGDLTEAIAGTGSFEMTHQLESVKILQKDIENPPHLYGDITREAIARAEIQNPNRLRIVCMAISATDTRDRGCPSSWSAAIDNLGAGVDNGEKRLMVIPAGNTPEDQRHLYPYSNEADYGIHDPGQAWNAITVGAYTEKGDIDSAEYPGWKLVAPTGDLSPSSSTSMTWSRPWPIKPDIVLEGGNMAIDPTNGSVDYIDSLGLLTTHFQFINKPLVITGDTSAATALASRMAAQIQARYPEFWPETIRGLMIHSSEWTPAMINRYNPRTKNDYENLLRYCGYGVPNLDRAFWSAQNEVTLIAQDVLQPFDKKDSRYITRDLNIHDIPWPKDILQSLGETPVEMRITLSYFIEPNPARRGWGKKYSYRSHGLGFHVKRPEEPMRDFRARINRIVKEEEKGRTLKSPGDQDWELGAQLRKLGSVHSDT